MVRIFLTTVLSSTRKMTMSDGREDILAILEDLYLNVLEDVPDTYYTEHLQCAMDDAWEILCVEGVLKDE